MSIGLFDSINSSFHQQPLPSTSRIQGKGSVIPDEIIHQWNINDFVVSLIREQDSLKYKTTDKDQKEICTNYIEISKEENLEEMISYLKGSSVLIRDNGHVNFCSIYNTWETIAAEESLDISLVCRPEGLAWNVFNRSINKSCFLDFQKTTISSLRCHPETMALIEKIKTDAFDNMALLHSLIRDFEVRVVDPEEFKIKHEELKNLLAFNSAQKSKFVLLGLMGSLGIDSLALKAIKPVSTYVTTAFGSGIISSFTVEALKSSVGILSLGGGLIASAAAVKYFYPSILGRQVINLKKKIETLPQQAPLLIEIEPISIPSEIDPRMRVSKFTWAVTIVNGIEGPSKNHTAILVEGLANEYFQGSVPDGEYFIHKSEFNPPISSHLYSLRILKIFISQGMRRTKIWMKPSKQVMVMLQEITRQRQLHEEKLERGEKINWAFTGSDSWFSGGLDNCFTWTRKSVSMLGIKLGKNFHSQLFAWPRSFTDTIKEQEKNLFVDIKI